MIAQQQQIIDRLRDGQTIEAFAENDLPVAAYLKQDSEAIHLASLKALIRRGIIERYKISPRPQYKYDLWHYRLAEND
jgi:hypothetical protein